MTAAAAEQDAAGTEHDAFCLFCGEPERVALHEAWTDHGFLLDTCCEGLLQQVGWDMEQDPAWARELLRQLGAEEMLGHRLRRVASDGCCGFVLDWQLRTGPLAFRTARAFVGAHHAHCGPPIVARFSGGVWNGWTLIGVATVGNPVARALCGRGILEVNRLCIRRDLPSALRWNAASMLLGWCGAEAGRQGWRHLVTYTVAQEEKGTSLRAAGWQEEARVRGRSWHGGRRARSNTNAFADKIRWGKPPTPARQRTATPCRARLVTSLRADGGDGPGLEKALRLA